MFSLLSPLSSLLSSLLFSSLLFSVSVFFLCLSLSLSLCLSLSLSVCVFVRCCGRVVVVLWYVVACGVCVCVCGVCVWCGVCAVWCVVCGKRVSTCARGAGIHGDVWNGHTGGGEGRDGSSSASFFIGNTSVFDIFLHLNRMLGSSLIANFLLTKIGPHVGYHVLQRFTKSNLWILHILKMERGQHIPCTVQLDAQRRNDRDRGQGPPRQRQRQTLF